MNLYIDKDIKYNYLKNKIYNKKKFLNIILRQFYIKNNKNNYRFFLFYYKIKKIWLKQY